ncbi:hypothetical protein ACWKSP_01310 [Micromonosporaceae bacterium Da 78-11]
MRIRRTVVVASMALAVTVPTVLTAVAAFGQSPSSVASAKSGKPGGSAETPDPILTAEPTTTSRPTRKPTTRPTSTPTARPTSTPTGTSKPAKPVRKVVFTASGSITAVDVTAGTITVVAKGGTKDVRRRTVAVAVPATVPIIVGGARMTLADLAVGFRITVVGTRAGTAYTAVRIVAEGTKPRPSTTPSVEPSRSASPEPTDD